MNWSLMAEAFPRLLEGAGLTLQLTLMSLVAGFILALPLSLARTSSSPLLSRPVQAYAFLFRGTPLLVQLFLIYYGAGQIDWIRTSPAWILLRDPYWCALIAFTLNNAAYTAEILRGGIRAVPAGEIEAAKALGMPYLLRTRRIVLPAALRIALPAYANEVVLMLKASSLPEHHHADGDYGHGAQDRLGVLRALRDLHHCCPDLPCHHLHGRSSIPLSGIPSQRTSSTPLP